MKTSNRVNKIFIVSLIAIALSATIFGMANVYAQTESSGQSGSSGVIAPSETIVIPEPAGVIDPSQVPRSNLSAGTRNLEVKKIQEILKSLGYLPANLKPGQYFGPQTKKAIRKFQKDKGLPATGFFGPLTRQMLKKVLQSETGLSQQVVDVACMKTAVEKRENALISAYAILMDKTKAARETRKTDLLSAWSIQDAKERHKAINEAWAKFRKSSRDTHVEWLKSRNTAWVQFEKDRIACKAPSTGEKNSLEEVDAGLN